jgi:hypothetical protein
MLVIRSTPMRGHRHSRHAARTGCLLARHRAGGARRFGWPAVTGALSHLAIVLLGGSGFYQGERRQGGSLRRAGWPDSPVAQEDLALNNGTAQCSPPASGRARLGLLGADLAAAGDPSRGACAPSTARPCGRIGTGPVATTCACWRLHGFGIVTLVPHRPWAPELGTPDSEHWFDIGWGGCR